MLANDIKLYRIIRSPDDCLQLQRDIDVLAEWSKKWLLSFNVSKCKVLDIDNAATPCHHQYTLQQDALELLENIRDLGINMDSKLKFHTHTDTVTNKANHI